jgi:Cu2+-containing amine oxidase
MTDTAVHVGETSAGYPAHPLDPATAAEYLAGRDIMAAAGLLPEGDRGPVRFAYYGLDEPPKGDVLAGRADERRLRAFLVDTASGESTDVVVSLTHRDVVRARRLDPGRDGQMPILDSDFALVDEITKADQDWRAAMARRGYHDLRQVGQLARARLRLPGRQRPAGRSWQPLRQRHRAAGDPADPRVAGRPPRRRRARAGLAGH